MLGTKQCSRRGLSLQLRRRTILIIGESINAKGKEVGAAISARNLSSISRLAREQVAAGAEMLDVSGGLSGAQEADNLRWLVQTVQAEVNVPLMLDSTNPQALRAALEVHRGRSIINSISGEQHKLEELLPLSAEYNCGAVILCLDDQGIPKTAEARLQVAQLVVERATRIGLKAQDLYIDPLTLSIGADSQAAKITLATLRLIHERFPEVHTMCGVSNIGFGMPQRSLINATFLAMAIGVGLDTPMVNVCDKAIMAAIRTANAVAGNDPYCAAYLKAYRAGYLKP